MRIVVTGLAASYPLGGVAWDYLQYVEGFHLLGCDVHYLEDTGQWMYDPQRQTFTDDIGGNVRHLAAAMTRLAPGLARAWTVRGPDGTLHGLDEPGLARLCAGTDLFLNLSGACWLREQYRAARKTAYVNTDPCYVQARLAAVEAGTADEATCNSVALIRAHDLFFTLGEHIGAPDCTIPTCGIRWIPTRQPIVLHHWPVRPMPEGAFTTVMSWKIEPTSPVVGAHVYGGKDVEFERFLALPSHTPEVLEVALAGAAPRERIAAAGWRLLDGHAVSGTMDAYRDYILGSRGECSIAKNAYVATRSGWFSTRSAAYLACGKPVVLQETGFSAHLPVGPGLHAFSTIDEAVAALASVRADYPSACRHARDVAESCFDARDVCGRLLRDAGF